MSRRNLIIGVAVVAALGGWYAFRPERLFVDQTVAETFEATGGAPAALTSGRFHTVAHESRGVATIYENADGTRTLRLTDFETSNGPDVHIYLVATTDASDNETVTNAGFLDLGSMKGNIGDQNYDVPADLDLGQYRAVTIWCKRFGVNFGTAPLMSGPTVSSAFRVRVQNVSTMSTLKLSNGATAPAPTSPVAWAIVRGGNPLFMAGQPAGEALERLAEDGNPAVLAESLASTPGVVAAGAVAVPVGDTEAGPLLPGKSFEIAFDAQPGDRLVLAFMFGQSNDWFYATAEPLDLFDRDGRPLLVDHSAHLSLWDAGTEQNQEPGLGADQGPRQSAPDTGAAENGVVHAAGDDFPAPPVTSVVAVSVGAGAVANR